MHDVYKLKDMLCEELEEYGKKEEVSLNDLEIIDKLAHSIKNIDKVLEYHEEEKGGYSNGGRDMMDRRPYDDRYMRGGMSYARDGRGGRRDMGGSRRGGYSRGGYSMADESMKDMIDDMREMMDDMPEEKRREMQKFISKMEQM